MRNNALKLRNKDERMRFRLDSLRVYQRAKLLDPRDGRAYVGIGQVLRQLGEYDAARQCYQDGCDATGGDNPYIWQAWGTLEAEEGNISKARQLYDAATAADKNTRSCLALRGAIFEKITGKLSASKRLVCEGNADGASFSCQPSFVPITRSHGHGARTGLKKLANTSRRVQKQKRGLGQLPFGKLGQF